MVGFMQFRSSRANGFREEIVLSSLLLKVFFVLLHLTLAMETRAASFTMIRVMSVSRDSLYSCETQKAKTFA